MLKTTYSNARAHFAGFCDEVIKNREIVIVHRRGTKSVAIIASDELESLVETAHLLRSPRNAKRLFASLNRALKRQGRPSSLSALRKDLGIEE